MDTNLWQIFAKIVAGWADVDLNEIKPEVLISTITMDDMKNRHDMVMDLEEKMRKEIRKEDEKLLEEIITLGELFEILKRAESPTDP
jgi:hypothetical protein